MLKDKYTSIVSHQMEAIVLSITLQTFFTTCLVLKIGEYQSFTWGIFGHVTCLDYSSMGQNVYYGF